MKNKILLLLISLLLIITPAVFAEQNNFELYLFHTDNCQHCSDEKIFLEKISNEYPQLRIHSLEISEGDNAKIFSDMCKAYGTEPLGVPMTFIGENFIIGYRDDETTGKEIRRLIEECDEECINPIDKLGTIGELKNNKTQIIDLPIFGKIDATKIGLPLFTIIIGGLDGFNPCAIWVLCFLLTLLIYAQSRKKMILIGSIFVLASGIVYFLFMTAWLNFFLIIGYVDMLRIIIALIAVIVGLINIKEFIWFGKGVSLKIPERLKPKLVSKIRELVHEGAIPATIIGTIILAFTANTFELLCTVGFPAIYTRILTLNNLPSSTYYAYLVLYNIIYVLPLAVIVGIFSITMGSKKFTHAHAKGLKLIGGLLMLILGLLLLFVPQLLSF